MRCTQLLSLGWPLIWPGAARLISMQGIKPLNVSGRALGISLVICFTSTHPPEKGPSPQGWQVDAGYPGHSPDSVDMKVNSVSLTYRAATMTRPATPCTTRHLLILFGDFCHPGICALALGIGPSLQSLALSGADIQLCAIERIFQARSSPAYGHGAQRGDGV